MHMSLRRHCVECGCEVKRTFFMDEGRIYCVECASDHALTIDVDEEEEYEEEEE